MPFPNFPNKYHEKSFVTAQDFWKYKKKIGRIPHIDPPKAVILCYSSILFNYLIEYLQIKKIDYVFDDYFYLLEEKGETIGICGAFGIGGPRVAIVMEELNAFGIKIFLSIGTAGSLQNKLQLGSVVICDKAIRDEGTSHHYLKSKKYSYSSNRVTEKLIEVVKNLGLDYAVGTSWTIDAPYRETYKEIEKYKQENVLTVEMEAATIFAVAEYLQIEAGVIFTISDYLFEDEWNLHFHLTTEHLKTLFTVAKETINSL